MSVTIRCFHIDKLTVTLSFWLTSKVVWLNWSGGNRVTLNAGIPVLNSKKVLFVTWLSSEGSSCPWLPVPVWANVGSTTALNVHAYDNKSWCKCCHSDFYNWINVLVDSYNSFFDSYSTSQDWPPIKWFVPNTILSVYASMNIISIGPTQT